MQDRLAQSRKSAGLSLRALADEVGVSAMALSKYERGLIKPSQDVLNRLIKALGVSREFLQGERVDTLQHVEYRARARMTPISKRQIHGELLRQIEARFRAEELVSELRPDRFQVPRLPKHIDDLDSIEGIAESLRARWQLGEQPIANLTNVLEDHGIRTFTSNTKDAYFDGLSAHYGDHPIVATGSDWLGDRQRFTLAHELGHLVMQGRLAAHIDEEQACNRFAGALIAPAKPFKARFSNDASNTFAFYMLKHEWGLSMNACLYRCSDLGLISQADARRWWAKFRKRGWRELEPGLPLTREYPTRLWRLLVDAYVAGRLDVAMVATLLNVPADVLDQFVDLGNNPDLPHVS